MSPTKGTTRYILIVVFVTGATVMMLEILGTRVLGPHYGLSLYVWSALISVTLGFLAIGYYLGGRWVDKKPSITILNWILFMAGVIVLVLPFVSVSVVKACHILGLRLGSLLSSVILFGPTMALLGTVIPFSVRISTEDIDALGLSVGKIYAVSTLGSVAGTLVVGFLLIPNLGLRQVLFIVALLLFLVSGTGHVLQKRFTGIFFNVFMGGMVCFFGVFAGDNIADGLDFSVLHHTQSCYGELKVLETTDDRLLVIDGMIHTAMPKDWNSLETQSKLLSHNYYLELLPWYYPEGSRCLLIGLGGGLFPAIIAKYGIVVESVEIDPKVVDIARRYFGFNGRVEVCDGRYYVSKTKEKYDYCVLDAYLSDSMPVHLFTREFFEEIKKILVPEGILAINHIGIPEASFLTDSLYQTLRSVFNNLHIYPTEDTNEVQVIFLFASDSMLRLRLPEHRNRKYGIDKTVLNRVAKKRLQVSGGKGVVITDNYNPVELHWARIATTWRKRTSWLLGQ